MGRRTSRRQGQEEQSFRPRYYRAGRGTTALAAVLPRHGTTALAAVLPRHGTTARTTAPTTAGNRRFYGSSRGTTAPTTAGYRNFYGSKSRYYRTAVVPLLSRY